MSKGVAREKNGNKAKLRLIILTKKRLFFAIIAIILAVGLVFGCVGAVSAATPAFKYVVVIDAGHGGIDGGVVGKNGYKESDFNLEMSKTLGKLLTKGGFKVVYTRTDDGGLYSAGDDNKKLADMKKRKEIIQGCNPDFVISIHANKFPGDSRRGAQVFYDEFNSSGKTLAEGIQSGLNGLNQRYVGRSFAPLAGDYYMLKCTLKPSVIVECGFLSNEEDEKLLRDEEYREQIALAIYGGIADFSLIL